MGTRPIFESDFDCLTERFETYVFMNDVDSQIEKASTEANGLFEDGKLNSREYQRMIEEIASAKAELDYYKTHFRRFDCSMDQAKTVTLHPSFFDFDGNKSFPIWNLLAESVGNLHFQAKPVLISCGPIKRRALEIAVEVKGDPKDLILIEIFCESPNTIREIFLGKRSATAIFLFEDIRNTISTNEFNIFVGHREVELKKLIIMRNSIQDLTKKTSESLIPNRRAGISKSTLIPSRNNPKPQKLPSQKFMPIPVPQRSNKKNNFSLKQLETGISRKYGEPTDWMKKEPTKQKKNEADLIMVQEYTQTKEVPQRNYNELIYEENFPL